MSDKVTPRKVTFQLREAPTTADRQFLAIPPQFDSKTNIELEHIQVPISRPPVIKRDPILLKDSGSTEDELAFSSRWQIRMPSKLTASSNSDSARQTQPKSKGKMTGSGRLNQEELLRVKLQRPASRLTFEDYNVEDKNRLEEKIHLAEQKMKELASSYQAAREEKQAILEHKQVRHVKSMVSILKSEIKAT